MAAFDKCEQEAGTITAARLRDAGFRQRLERSSKTWNMEFPFLGQKVQTIIAIALFSAHGSADHSPAQAAKAALTALSERTVVELFDVLPQDLGESASQVRHLRLVSIGLTAPSTIMWERLLQTARNMLDQDAEYPDEDHLVQTQADRTSPTERSAPSTEDAENPRPGDGTGHDPAGRPMPSPPPRRFTRPAPRRTPGFEAAPEQAPPLRTRWRR